MVSLYELFKKIKSYGFAVDSIKIQANNECYFYGSNNKINVCSSAKTITSIAFGIAKEKYNIEYNDPIIKYFPEYSHRASPGTEKIRIIDLLHMQSGKRLQSLFQESGKTEWTTDWLTWFFEAPLDMVPGTKFFYSSHCCYVIGRLIKKLSGLDLNDFLLDVLWNPLHIIKPIWGKCSQGYSISAGELMLSCTDLFAIGKLLLQYGYYDNASICPRSYINAMTKSIVKSCNPFVSKSLGGSNGYGLFIWEGITPNTFCSWGAGGTFCMIDYGKQSVVAVTSLIDNNWRNRDDFIILEEVNQFLKKF